MDNQDRSSLMKGIVIATTGFDKSESLALKFRYNAMGAEHRNIWGPDCTLLVAKLPNSPACEEARREGKTIVGKDWIRECYQQRRMLDISPYLIESGTAWMKGYSGPEVQKWAKSDFEESLKSLEGKGITENAKDKVVQEILTGFDEIIDDLKKTLVIHDSKEQSSIALQHLEDEIYELELEMNLKQEDLLNIAIGMRKVYQDELSKLQD